MHVFLLTQWFDPEPAIKGLAFARELRRFDIAVTVLTGFPNYPQGRLYPGYRLRLLQREEIDGVRIYRVPLFPSHDRSAARRALNYLSFAASSLCAGVFLARRADLVYVYHPPLTVSVAGALIGALVRRPVVCDIQDMWPDTLSATGMLRSPRLLLAIGALCKWVYGRVDRIVVLSPGFRRLLVQRGVPAEKVDVIYNWADEAALAVASANAVMKFPPDGRFRVLFAGNMGSAQALDVVLNAAAILSARASRVTFVLIGGGVERERLRQRCAGMALDNVDFLDPVPMAEVGAFLRSADALLVHLRDDPLFATTIPSKTQAYMAVGRPLIVAVRGDAAELVERSGGGIVALPDDAASLAAAAERLASFAPERLAEMGVSAQSFYREHLSIQRGTKAFVSLFRELTEQRGC